MLNAFQAWEDVRMNGPMAEENFCDHKQLSIPTLRVTWEAKVSVFIHTMESWENVRNPRSET